MRDAEGSSYTFTMRSLRPAESQWIFDNSALENSPSRHDEITLQDELERRKNALFMIRSLAFRTFLVTEEDTYGTAARGVLTTASVFLHRFYMRRSLRDFPEPLIAATLFFLASKVEEQSVKLRYIVNACLSKFEKLSDDKLWDPHRPGDPGPSSAYRRWEAEILAAEEIVLETLCFDLCVEHPWTLLQKSVRGMDSKRAHQENSQDTRKVTEPLALELSWALLNEAYLSPIGVLHHPLIIAFSALVLIFALAERRSLSEALAEAAELGWKFDLDISFDEEAGATGTDLQQTKDCLNHLLRFSKMGIWETEIMSLLPAESVERMNYTRRFRSQEGSVEQAVQESAAVEDRDRGAHPVLA